MVYRGNIVESVVANSLETEGMIENCLSMTGAGGWVGHKNITDGGVGGVIKILQIRGGGEGIRLIFSRHNQNSPKRLPLPSPPLPSPTIINDRVLNCQCYHQIFFHRLM